MIKIDLHVHTRASRDGMNHPRHVARQAMRRGLSGIAVTDHDTDAAVAAVRAAAPPGFIVIPGVEYSTDGGHMLALFCEGLPDAARDEKGRFRFSDVAAFTRDRGGLLVAAHPFHRTPRPGEARDPGGYTPIPPDVLSAVQGLEVANARELSRRPGSLARVTETARQRGLFVTGGSDGHLGLELGGGYTLFPDDCGTDLERLKNALASGSCTVEGRPGNVLYRAFTTRVWKRIRRDWP